MQKNSDRWPEDYDPDTPRSRPGSRRNSASLSRRSSLKKEKEGKKKSPLNTAPSSSNSTPKKAVKQNLDFVVTGKQILKRGDRANSLPGYHRRPSAESLPSIKKRVETKRPANTKTSQSSRSRETSLEDDMSLELSQITESITMTLSKTCCDGNCPQNTSKSSRSDDTSEDMLLNLSQVSDFEDTNSKYGVKQKFKALATSTPKSQPRNFQKPRSASLQSQMHSQKVEGSRKSQKVLEGNQSRESTFSCSRDSLYKTSSPASYRYGNISTELDYSSVSPEYSGQSSADVSPRVTTAEANSPRSHELHTSSCCVSSWQDSEVDLTKVEGHRDHGEWTNFWANYNNSVAKVPMKSYYDQCPTPYRTENIDMADLEFSEASRKRSPDDVKNLNNIIRNEGLHLTPRETQNIIKCAHILGNVLSKAIERRSKEKDENEEKIQELDAEKEKIDQEVEIKKKTMTLDLKETHIPLDVQEEKRSETVTTQTDISLPNTKSAPKIFEKILRQLSRTSLDESLEKSMERTLEKTFEKDMEKKEVKEEEKIEAEAQKEKGKLELNST